MDMKKINALVEEMTVDELCGQLLCFDISGKWAEEEFEEIVKKTVPGGLFFNSATREEIKKYTDIVNKYTKAPVIIAADVENGPGCVFRDEEFLPHLMAWGACDDETLIEKAGEATAAIVRKNGIHWAFAPVIDINRNPDNPVTNIRAVSDSPKQVVKIASAYLRGLQKNNMMVASCKHFPGDGIDDRNQHFCTTINDLTKEEWMDTFGYVYKELIKAGTASIMVAHIALPAYDDEMPSEILGYKPAIISHKLITELLKGELGYKGCVVSDALTMIGSCSIISEEQLVVEFIKAGGDMALFAKPIDFDRLKNAVENGEIPMERIKDAVRRVLVMKNEARLFDDNKLSEEEIEEKYEIRALADEIGEKSIKIVRNADDILPLDLKKGDKVLIVNIQRAEEERVISPFVRYLDTFEEELRKRGFDVEVMPINATHNQIQKKMDEAKCVLVNCKIGVQDYLGGSLRVGWVQIMAFWRGLLLKHPCVVFTSFGDPYKLYDYPYLHTYVNAFSSSDASQRGVVKILLGEKAPVAKNPVTHKGFFEREVE